LKYLKKVHQKKLFAKSYCKLVVKKFFNFAHFFAYNFFVSKVFDQNFEKCFVQKFLRITFCTYIPVNHHHFLKKHHNRSTLLYIHTVYAQAWYLCESLTSTRQDLRSRKERCREQKIQGKNLSFDKLKEKKCTQIQFWSPQAHPGWTESLSGFAVIIKS
jgi:hypothetical protein